MNNHKTYVINIGRQLGSGGRQIGHLLAERFGYSYYDKEILSMASEDSGLSTEIFERSDENKGIFRSVFGSIMPLLAGSDNIYGNQISDESLFRIQSESIRRAAAAQSCIFIGRCADYVLRDKPEIVNIFISADTDDRIHRLVSHFNVDRKSALKMIEKGDETRANYYNFFSGKVWGAASSYHYCINSSVLGTERTADFIEEFVRAKLHL